MGNTITVRLTKELAEWLEGAARTTGRPQGSIVRDQLEKARAGDKQVFLRLAGAISGGPRNLSSRKGFSRT
jgi:hypothetical protein